MSSNLHFQSLENGTPGQTAVMPEANTASLERGQMAPAKELVMREQCDASKLPLELRPFPFRKLAAEVRDMIYKYHLMLEMPICPMKANNDRNKLSFIDQHERNCPMNKHLCYTDRLGDFHFTCEGSFCEKRVFDAPSSVLALLLVCRQIHHEAVPIFYRHNNFMFPSKPSLKHIRDFINGIGTRYQFLTELTFRFTSTFANEVFKKLDWCPELSRLNIVLNQHARGLVIWPKRESPLGLRIEDSMTDANGMASLLKLRGLKFVNVSLEDHIQPGMPTYAGMLDCMHLLEDRLTLPRERPLPAMSYEEHLELEAIAKEKKKNEMLERKRLREEAKKVKEEKMKARREKKTSRKGRSAKNDITS